MSRRAPTLTHTTTTPNRMQFSLQVDVDAWGWLLAVCGQTPPSVRQHAPWTGDVMVASASLWALFSPCYAVPLQPHQASAATTNSSFCHIRRLVHIPAAEDVRGGPQSSGHTVSVPERRAARRVAPAWPHAQHLPPWRQLRDDPGSAARVGYTVNGTATERAGASLPPRQRVTCKGAGDDEARCVNADTLFFFVLRVSGRRCDRCECGGAAWSGYAPADRTRHQFREEPDDDSRTLKRARVKPADVVPASAQQVWRSIISWRGLQRACRSTGSCAATRRVPLFVFRSRLYVGIAELSSDVGCSRSGRV